MNQLLLRSSSYLWRHGNRLLKVQLLSTNAATSSFSSASSPQIDSLQRRISTAGDPSVSMISVIDQWLEEGKKVKMSELRKFIKLLRKYRRCKQALQISEWMTGQGGFRLSGSDVAVQLDLIVKVHGLEKAEAYFNTISESSRDYQVYGALLNCYAYANQLEKAETIMQNLKDMGFLKTALPYNVMLGLYSRMGRYEKMDALMQEMEEKGIECDTFTFNIRLQAYVACSDFDGMEKLLTKMEADPHIKIGFHSYLVAGNGYLLSGLTDKSLKLLRKSEQLISDKSRKFAYECLLTSYAAAGSKAEVYRVWNLYKQMGKFFNAGYISMIGSLVKLDDLDSAEKIWEEWDSGMELFDIRIPNLMISAYSRKGDWEKAEAYVKKIIEKGEEPNVISWDHLAAGYLRGGQITKGVESIKKAISTCKPGRTPRLHTLATCLNELKDQGDKEAAEELLKMINEQCHLSTFAYDRLSSCINDEDLASNVFDQIEDDDGMFDESPTEAALPETETPEN
ncbi:pentatricopeptide repeat-containing protein At2g20710, mitochondrial-like [Euphorbia lathyris]|uniref:pentatricopeptide repeat-containing protein At2g20710, mitochondrial-like n=1 Tax=Euphorbia lathyris TaxID=212925 RepID=UPI003313476C